MIYLMFGFVVDVNNREIVWVWLMASSNIYLINNQLLTSLYSSKKRIVRKASNYSIIK